MNFTTRFASTLLAGTSAFITLTSLPIYQNTSQASTPIPINGLSSNDARAKLNPKLKDVPDMPQPAFSPKARTSAVPGQEIEINIKTKRVKKSAIRSVAKRSSGPQVAEGNLVSGSKVLLEKKLLKALGSYSVIGTDQRVKISDTASYPWRAQAKLYTTIGGVTYGCSGTLIAAKYVLTAGHCVHDGTQWASRVEVIPGLNGSYKPFGSAFATRIRSYTGWTVSQSPNHDFALITLDRTIGNTTGWFGYGYFPSINGITANISGYPGDKGGIYQYYDSDPVKSSTSNRVFYQVDTAPGQSGSSVYRFYTPPGGSSGRYAFGIHAYGTSNTTSGTNSGTRIDSTKFSSLQSWIGSGL